MMDVVKPEVSDVPKGECKKGLGIALGREKNINALKFKLALINSVKAILKTVTSPNPSLMKGVSGSPCYRPEGSRSDTMTPLRLAIAMKTKKKPSNPQANGFLVIPPSMRTTPNRGRRKPEELTSDEKWHCPFHCGKYYKRTSTKSIRKHILLCTQRPKFSQHDSSLTPMPVSRGVEPTAKSSSVVLFPDEERPGDQGLLKVVDPSDSNFIEKLLGDTAKGDSTSDKSLDPKIEFGVRGSKPPLSSNVTINTASETKQGPVLGKRKQSSKNKPTPLGVGLNLLGIPSYKRRRKSHELKEKERWYCRFGCGKFYRRTSSGSISAHLTKCALSPSNRPKQSPTLPPPKPNQIPTGGHVNSNDFKNILSPLLPPLSHFTSSVKAQRPIPRLETERTSSRCGHKEKKSFLSPIKPKRSLKPHPHTRNPGIPLNPGVVTTEGAATSSGLRLPLKISIPPNPIRPKKKSKSTTSRSRLDMIRCSPLFSSVNSCIGSPFSPGFFSRSSNFSPTTSLLTDLQSPTTLTTSPLSLSLQLTSPLESGTTRIPGFSGDFNWSDGPGSILSGESLTLDSNQDQGDPDPWLS